MDTEARARRDWADWSSNRRSYLLAWGLPTALLIVSILLPAPIRTVVWAGCLIWQGAACVANAARCGRTHCYATGPFFLVMAAVTVAYGAGMISLGSQGWLWIGAAVAVGTVVLWIAFRAGIRQVLDAQTLGLTASTKALPKAAWGSSTAVNEWIER